MACAVVKSAYRGWVENSSSRAGDHLDSLTCEDARIQEKIWHRIEVAGRSSNIGMDSLANQSKRVRCQLLDTADKILCLA